MTCAHRCNYVLAVPITVGILCLVIAMAAPSQSSGQGSARHAVLSVVHRAGAEAADPKLLLGVGQPHRKSRSGALDSQALFRSPVLYNSGGQYAVDVAVADVNGDGHLDLIVVNDNTGSLGVLLGNGDGTFRSAVTFYPGAYYPGTIRVGDLNGDGKPDIVLTAADFSSSVLVL